MDNGLVHVDIETLQNYGNVLILIVVDNGLVPSRMSARQSLRVSLNPYCSGRWSRTGKVVFGGGNHVVLILIVVDNGLVLEQKCQHRNDTWVLILIVVDNGLVPAEKEAEKPAE